MTKQPIHRTTNTIRHAVKSQDFSTEIIRKLFERADEIVDMLDSPEQLARLQEQGKGRQVFTLFYEPSTRTRVSFEAAANNLGLRVVGTENAREFSSASKGETIEDTIRVLCQYRPAAIVMRHHEEGAAARAAAVSSVPIINGGDGRGQHPTQALLDLYTIQRELGRTDNLHVVIGGDLANGRTGRSLVYMLTKFSGVRFSFVAPESLEMSEDIKDHLREHKVAFVETQNLEEVLGDADVVYWTRVQKERLAEGVDYQAVASRYELGQQHLGIMKQNSIIMHPLPRVDEIKTEIDADPRAAYFRQAGYGLPVRMALYEWSLGLI